MPRYFLIPLLFLALVFAAPVCAADRPSGDNNTARGGLVCRSVDGQHGQSCDGLCSKAKMACTGVGANRNPPLRCGDLIDDTIPPFPVCRCCALEHH
jgi:hypothetical protein